MMNQIKKIYYPTFLQAIHLLILYLFIQTLVDFPLALIDYYKGTDYLFNPVKKVVLNAGSTIFILIYGIKRSKSSIHDIFPVRMFNILILLPLFTFFWGAHNLLDEVNMFVEKVIPAPPWFWELFSQVFESDFGWWGAFLKIVIVAPVIEELIFRGIILNGLRKNHHAASAIFLSAVLFSLFHLNPWQMPATFILGLLLGWLTISTKSILPAILGHAMNNLMVLLSVTYQHQTGNNGLFVMPKNEKLILSSVVVMFSILIIYFLNRWSFKRRTKSFRNQS